MDYLCMDLLLRDGGTAWESCIVGWFVRWDGGWYALLYSINSTYEIGR